MARRNISEKRRSWLVSQIGDWRSQGIVSGDQASQILDLYETRAGLAERKRAKALLSLMGLAAFLVGLGGLLLVGYNWQGMPNAVKLLIIFGTVTGTQALGLYLRFKRQKRLLSEVVIFLSCIFYGIGIFLVAQMFHVNAHYSDAVWWWALGILPFALFVETPLLHVLLASLLALWCGMEVIGLGDIGMWFFGRRGFMPNGAYTLPLLALPGLLWAYRKRSVATVFLYVPLLAWWLILQPIAWNVHREIVFYIGAVGGLMLVLAESHSAGSRFSIPYRMVGVLLSTLVFMTMSFYDFCDWVLRYKTEEKGLVQMLALVILLAASTYLVVWFNHRGFSAALSVSEKARRILRRQGVPVGLQVTMLILLVWHLNVGEPLLPTIVANLAMVSLALWLMNVGLRDNHGQFFAAGVLIFLIWAIVRYLDLFSDFGGMLGAAAMFFLCGGALFGVAMFWRKRKQEHTVDA